jgi:putative ABC transport system ATP-binding protein
MIRVSGLNHSVQLLDGTSLQLLHDIALQVDKGESLAIIGASGSGKTTLLTLLATLETPSSGEIWLNGQNVAQMDEEARAGVRAASLAFVFQNFQLLENLTALENVALPLGLRAIAQPAQRARQYLERVGLGHRLEHLPGQLSGGEQQRVALARAFACEAPVLFADEPTGNLDAATGEAVADLLFEMNAQAGTTLVLVTHDKSLAARCKNRYSMAAGRLEWVS